VLTLRAVFGLALRQTEGLIASILRLLGLDLAAPDHSTISRRGETLPAPRPRTGSEAVHTNYARRWSRFGSRRSANPDYFRPPTWIAEADHALPLELYGGMSR